MVCENGEIVRAATPKRNELSKMFLITFHLGGLEMILSDFEVSVIKSLRLVRSNTFGVNGEEFLV